MSHIRATCHLDVVSNTDYIGVRAAVFPLVGVNFTSNKEMSQCGLFLTPVVDHPVVSDIVAPLVIDKALCIHHRPGLQRA